MALVISSINNSFHGQYIFNEKNPAVSAAVVGELMDKFFANSDLNGINATSKLASNGRETSAKYDASELSAAVAEFIVLQPNVKQRTLHLRYNDSDSLFLTHERHWGGAPELHVMVSTYQRM